MSLGSFSPRAHHHQPLNHSNRIGIADRRQHLRCIHRDRRRIALLAIILMFLMYGVFSLLTRLSIVRLPYTPIAVSADREYQPNHDVSYVHAKECLKVSGIDLSSSVPDRPSSKLEEHYREVLEATAPWRSHDAYVVRCHMGFCGPWLENWWVDYFCCDMPQSSFGPYVPLFIQWTDYAETLERRTHSALKKMLTETLRPDVIYITVSHDAEGIRVFYKMFPNILVLGAGGIGHVPLPHLFRSMDVMDIQPDSYFMSFIGAVERSIRPDVVEAFNASLAEHDEPPIEVFYHYGVYSILADAIGMNWEEFVRVSQLNLAPRGYGVTSYRLYEILQLGAIPINVWGPYRWLPYQCPAGSINPSTGLQRGLNWTDLYFEVEWSPDKDVFRTRVETLVAELVAYKEHDPAHFDRRRERIVSVKDTHFTHEAVMSQIHRFMVDPPASDLCCDQLSGCFTMSAEPGTHFLCQMTPERVREWGASGGEWGGINEPLGP